MTGWDAIFWGTGEPAVADRLREVILPWRGTRYAKGQSCRGVATNCVGFLCRVLEELQGEPAREIPVVADDAAFHDRKTATAAMRKIIAAYGPVARSFRPHREGAGTIVVTPGDVLITGPANGGPGHAAIVGWERNTIWQASSGGGVHMAALTIPRHRLFRVLWPDKMEWVRCSLPK